MRSIRQDSCSPVSSGGILRMSMSNPSRPRASITGKQLQAQASRPTVRPGEDEVDEDVEVEERVTIRSLDERVAIRGKNFSVPALSFILICDRLTMNRSGPTTASRARTGLLKLRTSSFLIMDESTTNLDHATAKTFFAVGL